MNYKKLTGSKRKVKDGLTKSQRYNRNMEKIFANAERFNQNQMKWLREQGISEDEIQNAKRNTGLHGSELSKLVLRIARENGDTRENSDILGEAMGISDSRKVKDYYNQNWKDISDSTSNPDAIIDQNYADAIDAELSKLDKKIEVWNYKSSENRVLISADYENYKRNKEGINKIMSDFGYVYNKSFPMLGTKGYVIVFDKKVSDSRKVKDGYSNNPNYFGDWYGKGQIDFNAIINPEDEGDVYMVKLWCGSGYVLDVYLCKADSEEEAMDIVFDWSFNNEGKNEMVFEYSYLRAECVEDFYDEYGVKPSDFGGDYNPSISELCDEINRMMDKADEETMNGNLNNGFNLYEDRNNTSAAENLFDEYLIDWNLNEIGSEKKEGHYLVKSYLLSKDEGNCNAILLKTRTTQYGENIIECREIDADDDMGEYGVDYENYEEYEESWFDNNYIMAENGLYARDENFFVGKVPEDVLAENGYES